VLLQLHPLVGWARAHARALVCTALLVTTVRATTQGVESPRPERIAAREAWRLAESLAASHPDFEVVVGRGGSMLPLYPDGTVLVLQRLPLESLQRGMTVVFIGDNGRPVAHLLVEKTWRGWIAKGLNNSEADNTRVRTKNYLGAVVRAFTPVLDETAERSARSEAAGGE